MIQIILEFLLKIKPLLFSIASYFKGRSDANKAQKLVQTVDTIKAIKKSDEKISAKKTKWDNFRTRDNVRPARLRKPTKKS